MKSFLFILGLFLFTSTANSTTYYISPTGNDATGTGAITNPWKTLYKATSTVSAAGDIIHVNAGTYTETLQCSLKVGVSIEGDGVSSVLRSTLSADWTEMLSLKSAEGTNGNQHISNVKFDGQNLTTFWGIYIAGRSNVSVHDITMVNFKNRGVIFGGRNDNQLGPPAIFATGNTFYNNIIDNCADYDQILGYGAGALCIGGQTGMLIYNNTITQNSRPAGHNGWPIKYQNDGYLNGCKIYNNTLNKILNSYPLGANNWDFAIELFNESGLEIYNNNLNGGSIDINHNTKGSYAFAAWIHDNNIIMPSLNNNIQTGITLEFETDGVIIENNTIDKVNLGILFTPRNGNNVTNVVIRKNLITNVGMAEATGFLINMGNYGASNISWNNIDIYNNTLLEDPAHPTFWGIKLPNTTSGTLKNIRIKNNIIANAMSAPIVQQGGSVAIDSLNISNNNIYGNGNSNNPLFESPAPAPTRYTFLNNLKLTPAYAANYTLSAGSPLIDAGIDVGLTFTGNAPDMGYAEYSGANSNIAPTANAGIDQSITLPTNSVNLTGSGTDPDGTINAYLWTKISGPAAGIITNAALANTAVTGLAVGTYLFELRVTDNNGAAGKDTMQVIVNPGAVNIAPTANAGIDQVITLPTNSVNLTGSGTDPDGTINAYLWTKISGPTAGTITNAASASTSVTGLAAGIYLFELRVTDNSGATAIDVMQVIVNPAANIAPVANAGADQSITLPTSSVNLTGSGTDPDGTINAYLWTKISGPAAGTITNAASASTAVTGMIAGIYQFQLRVTDNSGVTAIDVMQVIVNPAANIAPVANAGADQSITLPTSSVNLTGSGTDPDGTINAYLWTKISGPAAGTITNAASASTAVTGMIAGIYQFQLRVTDNSGATATDVMQVIVNPAPNVLPTANAGADQSITLPTSSVNLAGSGTDPDGTINAYLWTKISGPAAGTITNAASASTAVTGLVAGIYQFELKVTDNSGAIAIDVMQVIVFAPNIPPVANAGLSQSITLPTNVANLNGSGNDVDGFIASYRWTKISGPATGIISNATIASTTVTGLTEGIYQFELRVTDNNGASATAVIQVTVNPENIPPVANAGPDQFVISPANSVTLNGSGTDVDGIVVSYKWRQISGPADKLTSPNTAVTFLDNLIAGSYTFELTVTDDKGATGKDTTMVTVTVVTAPSGNSIKVYPNPIADIANLDILSTTANTTVLVSVTDMMGKVIYNKKIATGTYTTKEKIDMSNLPKGTYLVTAFFSNQEKLTLKAIKVN